MIKAADMVMEQASRIIARINEKNPYYVVIGIFIALLVVDYFLVLQFQMRSLNSLNPKITSLSQELQSAQNNIQRLPQFQQERDRLKAQLDKTNRKIRTKEEVPVLLENVSLIANRNGVRIEQVRPDRAIDKPILTNEDGQYFSMPVVVEASSGYHHFGSFLNQLETEGDLVTIPEFVITASDKDTQRQRINLTINAIVFEKNTEKVAK